ncbi:hypothetical protein Sar04_14910 [Salinispora arenicola]|uniref:Uncharacterized protein n=1 Tax=Salinispora arenicola TaxID=168697 RepID=A0ABQ4JP62_SALAC|nr:hypothetical protein Sar04_14910 [Salinispora arenicola]
MVRRATSRWRIEYDYRDHHRPRIFEGRFWTGRHRHVALTAAAHLFFTRLRTTHLEAAGQTPNDGGYCSTTHARRYRTVHVQAGDHTITTADPIGRPSRCSVDLGCGPEGDALVMVSR